jgi:Zn2+/Cd2+-exporting ATPase
MVLGSLFEPRASLRARRAIAQLLRLAPSAATLLHAGGGEEVVAAEQLRAGDRILVRTGQRVAADGVVETGGGNFDTAAVTGESVPRYLRPGETALAGTLALDGSVVLRVTRTGEDSTVGRIIKIVRDAEHYQAPAMRIADRWARYYTPLILCVAAAAWMISALLGHEQTWQRAVAVLIVGCPCALVLATPTAIIAAMGRAAKLGVLIKSGTVLERAAQVDALVFDKTGTLTSGKHEVVAVVPANDLKALHEVRGLCPAVEHSFLKWRSAAARLTPSPGTPGEGGGEGDGERRATLDVRNHPHPNLLPAYREKGPDARHRLLALAAAVEYHSTHPFARAIREHAVAAGVSFAPAKDVKEIPGVGVTGRVDGQPVVVGRPEFVAHSVRNACAVPGTVLRPIQRYSVIAVEVAGRYAGLLLLQDTLRPAAEGVVEELRETGLRNLTVLSGDHAGAVKLVAERLRLDAAHAGLLPADKAERVNALRAQGHVVAFVGDGMNDAPALAVADVGIAMGGSGTDLALETADVVLLNDRLELLATLFALARRVRATIKMNLALGLALNVAALVLASTGMLSPMLGALVHNLGSAFVVGNSARLAAFARRPARAVVHDLTMQAQVRRAA